MAADEAVPATGQHRRPCGDCPWGRRALNGWLGGLEVADWLAAAHGEAHIECHTLTGAQCAGAAIYRANVGKVPRDRSQLRLAVDREAVFASPSEFAEHHSRLPGGN